MEVRDTLLALRRGDDLPRSAFAKLADGLANGDVSDAQAGAFAMAVVLKGLTEEGRAFLTEAMRDSGDVLSWDLPGPVLDKHSTGGIGDCVSLVLAPALAACGAFVPMISGRGLGHTGGTLDKLEAIPGLSTGVGQDTLRRMTRDIGCAIVAASGRIAPADKRLYAVRDVTGTVESLDLITASILSKKLAAGLDALVLDVKVGSGAFMRQIGEARDLATSLTRTAKRAGCPTRALITDMNAPLVPSMGNALEIRESMKVLTGAVTDTPLVKLTCALGGTLLQQGALTKTAEEGANRIADAIGSGAALERFGRMTAALGGPADIAEGWADHLPQASIWREVTARESGFVARFDGRALGEAVVHLGGGRLVETDRIDPSVGLSDIAPLGTTVAAGDPLAVIHAATEDAADRASASVQAAIGIGDSVPERGPLILEKIH
ncbi:thymidine phosphorylase [Aestuariibius insulae]|uniref:thymidine phosphorylase n=1 Tax=Aestuariibius insulae TaxID=2058287 RepID=UPI00345EF20A